MPPLRVIVDGSVLMNMLMAVNSGDVTGWFLMSSDRMLSRHACCLMDVASFGNLSSILQSNAALPHGPAGRPLPAPVSTLSRRLP